MLGSENVDIVPTGERSEQDVQINGEHPYMVLCMMQAR